MVVTEELVVGLDLGDRYSQVCMLGENGDVVKEAWVASTVKVI